MICITLGGPGVAGLSPPLGGCRIRSYCRPSIPPLEVVALEVVALEVVALEVVAFGGYQRFWGFPPLKSIIAIGDCQRSSPSSGADVAAEGVCCFGEGHRHLCSSPVLVVDINVS